VRNAYKIFVGKQPRRRWKDYVKMDLIEMGWEVVWDEFIWLRVRSSGGLL
jgi:hypothetical protein